MSKASIAIRACRIRSLCCASLMAVAGVSSSAALATPAFAAGAEDQRNFNIQGGALSASVLKFSEQAKVQVVAKSADLRGLQGNPVTGSYPVREALRRLIGDAPVKTEWVGPSTVALRAQPKAGKKVSVSRSSRAALAQNAPTAAEPSQAGGGEIIVTARKREETALETPVVLTAIASEELDRRAINSLDGIARAVPQLLIGEGGGTIQGGIIALRGITSPDSNPFADQSVSFNVDGVQVARASVRRLATMDLAQVEVLKGPQALFFGKNSPGGIISMQTADPTGKLEGKLSLGHEFNAREWRAEGFISAPLSDTLGVRVAGYYSKIRGWVKNTVPDGEFLKPERKWGPYGQEYAGRITLKWEPSDVFNVRMKLSHNKFKGDDAAANVQFVDCPRGLPQGGALDDCRPNDTISTGVLGPNFGLVQPAFKNGLTKSRSSQTLGSIEANYDLSDTLRLTSVSGFYQNRFWNLSNYRPERCSRC